MQPKPVIVDKLRNCQGAGWAHRVGLPRRHPQSQMLHCTKPNEEPGDQISNIIKHRFDIPGNIRNEINDVSGNINDQINNILGDIFDLSGNIAKNIYRR
jgi:hypothetical protein